MNHQHAPNGSRVQMPYHQRHLQIIYFASWLIPAWFIPWWPFHRNTPPRTPDKES